MCLRQRGTILKKNKEKKPFVIFNAIPDTANDSKNIVYYLIRKWFIVKFVIMQYNKIMQDCRNFVLMFTF